MHARRWLWLATFVAAVGCSTPGDPGDAATDTRRDTGTVDTGVRMDTGLPDRGVLDTGTPDVGEPDMGMAKDVAIPDAGPCPAGQVLCAGVCADTGTDNMNCGSCGNVCPTGQTCTAGACGMVTMCPTGQTRCGGVCVDTATDNTNCGTCGTVCMAGQACAASVCTTAMMCPGGQTSCGGVCVNTATDGLNCGTCGNACAAGQTCMAGACSTAMCPVGQTNCSGTCANTMTDGTNCGMCGRACAPGETCAAGVCTMGTCPVGQTMCGGSCVNTQTDNANCGSCGNLCGAVQICSAGACVATMVCPAGQIRCGAVCINPNTDGANCGGCGMACAPGLTCSGGACTCPAGQMLCAGVCVSTLTDAANCGACGMRCAGGQVCMAGACACPVGQMLCGGVCIGTVSDPANCGACGMACPIGRACSGGACVCPVGQMMCGGACVNTQTDSTNCGACARVCMGGQTCNAGVCACPAGQMNCTGTCRATQTDPANCGACARACTAAQVCTAGVCVAGVPPANDTRAGATNINLTMPSQSLVTNTATARNNTTGSCGCTGGQDVFYVFTLTAPEIVYADTIGTTWDTSLFLQTTTGVNITNAAIPSGAACNDDNGLGCTTNFQSMIAARLDAGTYYLVLSGCGSGPATIHFQHLPVGNGPIARLMPGASTQTIMGTTAGTGILTSACCSGGPENTFWWPSCPGFVQTPFSASTCGGATWDTELDQRSATRAAVSVCNDDSCGLRSTVNSSIPAGPGLNTLYLDGCGANSGAATITYTMGTCPAGRSLCGACVNLQTDTNNCGRCGNICGAAQFCNAGVCATPPANDRRAGATAISLAAPSSALAADTTNARNDTTGSCGCTSGSDVFYSFTLTRPEIVYADTIGATWDTSLFLQTNLGANIPAAGLTGGQTCNDDNGLTGCATARQSQIMARLAAGTYHLVLSGCGRGTASIRFHHLPVGNGAVTQVVAGAGQLLMGTTAGTGTITATCCSGGPENTYYWYTCQAAPTGTFTATTCGRAAFDTELDQRSAARAATSVCNDDSCGLQSNISTAIPAGPGLHTLYVDGCGAGAGAYSVLVTRP